ncbi:MAG: hypothetical protein KKD01_01280 [Proteobacteria bacterium]|nr:hypothetical protein [Pseudomonadota bacterium]MBU1418264.1 hypothetical protein [Pseudomonadota bacterium]MBU1453332.1 hypothetical protein [Pseudomonadota bacterium]
MRSFSVLIILFLLISSSGCARKINVTYHSDPTGASLYEGSKLMGYCPITLIYNFSYPEVKHGSKMLRGVRVEWISGATAKVDDFRAYIATGKYQELTFKRPSGIPGMEQDAMFGLEVQKVRLMQQQVQAQQSANRIQAYQSINTMIQNATPNNVNIKTNCTSRVVGSTIYTDCK